MAAKTGTGRVNRARRKKKRSEALDAVHRDAPVTMDVLTCQHCGAVVGQGRFRGQIIVRCPIPACGHENRFVDGHPADFGGAATNQHAA